MRMEAGRSAEKPKSHRILVYLDARIPGHFYAARFFDFRYRRNKATPISPKTILTEFETKNRAWFMFFICKFRTVVLAQPCPKYFGQPCPKYFGQEYLLTVDGNAGLRPPCCRQ